MKHAILAALSAAVLAGCATPMTYEQQRQYAKGQTDEFLCLATIENQFFKKVAEDELIDRKATCDWAKVQLLMQARQMQAQQKAAEDQQLINTWMLLNAMQPQPRYAAPINTTCSQLGNFVNCQTR